MTTGPTKDEVAFFDELTELTEAVWTKSKDVAGKITDPKLVSVILFKRLRASHKAYVILWNNDCYVEGEIIVRSAVETAICIAANFKMGEAFPRLMRRDAAATLQGQIKLFREIGDTEMVQSGEAAVRYLQEGFAEGEKAVKLDWKSLAEAGGVPQLYNFHKMLSGMSSHVTGLSLIREVGDPETAGPQATLRALSDRNYFNMMAGATLHGTLIQSRMIDDAGSVEAALTLTQRMDALSISWLDNKTKS